MRTSTIFERPHTPLNKWIIAIYMIVTARKGNSSLQLAKEIETIWKKILFCQQTKLGFMPMVSGNIRINHNVGQFVNGMVFGTRIYVQRIDRD